MTVPVAASWLKNEEGRFLLCRRKNHKARESLWEFPGGKLEEDETPGEA